MTRRGQKKKKNGYDREKSPQKKKTATEKDHEKGRGGRQEGTPFV